MKKITLLFLAITFTVFANAQLLYTFDSVKTTSGMIDPTPAPVGGPGITCASFMAVGTPPNSLAAFRFDFSGWALGSTGGAADTLFSGMTGSVNTAEYYEVSLTPGAGYSITEDSIKFDFDRSSAGVRTYSVRSSLDGYTANLNAVYGLPTTNVDVQAGNVFFLKKDITTLQTRNIIVLGPTFMNLVTPITFRFYGWNAEGTGGTFSIDNVNFIGSSTLLTGINEKEETSVRLFPNPTTNGIVTLDIANLSGKTAITVYDIIGNNIFSTETSSAQQLIDLSNQANGSYFVSIKNDKEVITKKIILNK